jgi:transcriptional regulator with XRE-family HTH domain
MAAPRSDFAARFGANLARARQRTDLSQEELAIRAELHRTAIGQLERGERVARADTLFKLSCVLAISPASFFDGIVWRSGRYERGGFEIPRSAA